MKRLVVTGATGSIGCSVVSKALVHGYDVTCIVHKGSTRVGNIPKSERVHIVECNVSDYPSLEMDGQYDVFIHLAWEKTYGALRDDVDIQTRNIQYTLDACRLAKRLGCFSFVGAGSQAEYGPKDEILTPELAVQPESGYGIAKYAAGKMSLMLCKQLGIRGNWIRIVSVYGPQDGATTLVNYTIGELKAGRSPKLTKCEQQWDYLSADDTAEGFIAVGERGKDGSIYVIGSGKRRQLSEYILDIKRALNTEVEIDFGAIEYFPHQPMFLLADIENLSEDTGWLPKITFKEGIEKLLKR